MWCNFGVEKIVFCTGRGTCVDNRETRSLGELNRVSSGSECDCERTQDCSLS